MGVKPTLADVSEWYRAPAQGTYDRIGADFAPSPPLSFARCIQKLSIGRIYDCLGVVRWEIVHHVLGQGRSECASGEVYAIPLMLISTEQLYKVQGTHPCPTGKCDKLEVWTERGVGVDDVVQHFEIRRNLFNVIVNGRKDCSQLSNRKGQPASTGKPT